LYAPFLRDQARLLSVPIGDRDQLIETLLDDIVVHLVEVEAPPLELTSYIVRSLRNRVRTRHRNATRARENDERAYSEVAHSTERIVAECHSEYAMRASRPLDLADDAPLRSAIKKLADQSARELSEEELFLLIGVGRRMPLRELGEQLGISHDAARRRLSRLRDRFIQLAIQYVRTLEPAERREIERFFRRADIHLSGTLTGSEASKHKAGERRILPRSNHEV
jgi:hypothetical protein